MLAGNLSGNPDDKAHDLVVYNALSGELSILRADGLGNFEVSTMQVGLGISELALLPKSSGPPDLILASQTTSGVTVLRNDNSGHFSADRANLFRSGDPNYPYGAAFPGDVNSLQRTVGLTVGDFRHTGPVNDIIAINAGAHAFATLRGHENGGLLDPVPTALDFEPSLVVSGQINDDNLDKQYTSSDHLDIAILDSVHGTVSIYLNNGSGVLTRNNNVDGKGSTTLLVGELASGLTLLDVTGDQKLDLLVGNTFGDVLILRGNGDGTFQPIQGTGRSIPLGVVKVDGKERIVLASESFDQIKVLPAGQLNGTAAPAFQDRTNGILGPDAIRLEDINRDGAADMLVANSGSNNVFVYLGLKDALGNPNGQFFVGQSSFAGTNPVAITTHSADDRPLDLNADGFLDIIVANKGSNDISILFGDGAGKFSPGPRLKSGGSGPVAVIVDDVTGGPGNTGDGVLDILVTNTRSAANTRVGSMAVLPGVGGGFFNDTNPLSQTVGAIPISAISAGIGQFFVINAGSGTLTRLNSQLQVVDTIGTRGFRPSSALAGDFNGDGSIDLIVGSNDGILELFLDNGGELLTAGFLDTDLNISAMALSVIQGSRVFYVTSDGVEQAFAFSLDDFAGEDRGTVANLPDDSVAIIAALVTGSAELDTEFFDGGDGETVNFGELLFFSDGGGGDSSSAALEQLREFFGQFVQAWAVTFGTGEGSGWQVIVSAVRSVLDTVGAVEVAGFNPFAGWQTVVAHLQLPGIGESLVGSLVGAGQATLSAGPVAGVMPGDAALRDFVFGRPLATPFDSFETPAVADATTVECQEVEPLLPEEAMSRWWALPVERQAEELLLAGLLAATLWKPEASGRTVPGRRPATERSATCGLPKSR